MKILLPEMVRFYKEVIWGGDPARFRGKWETVDELLQFSHSLGYSIKKEDLFNPMIEYPVESKATPADFVSLNLAEIGSQSKVNMAGDTQTQDEINQIEWAKVFHVKDKSDNDEMESILIASVDLNIENDSADTASVDAITLIDQYCGVKTKLKKNSTSVAKSASLRGSDEDFYTMLNLNVYNSTPNDTESKKKFLQKILSDSKYPYHYRIIGDFQANINRKSAVALYKRAEAILSQDPESSWWETRDLAFSVIKNEISEKWAANLIKKSIALIEKSSIDNKVEGAHNSPYVNQSIIIDEYKAIIKFLSGHKNTQLLTRLIIKKMQIIVDNIIDNYAKESSKKEETDLDEKSISMPSGVEPLYITMTYIRTIINYLQGSKKGVYLESAIEKAENWFLNIKPITAIHVDNFIELGKEIIVFTPKMDHGRRLLKKAEIIAIQLKDYQHMENIQKFVQSVLKDAAWSDELKSELEKW